MQSVYTAKGMFYLPTKTRDVQQKYRLIKLDDRDVHCHLQFLNLHLKAVVKQWQKIYVFSYYYYYYYHHHHHHARDKEM
jgi:hypothetical protein